jgi:hypothetical protein
MQSVTAPEDLVNCGFLCRSFSSDLRRVAILLKDLLIFFRAARQCSLLLIICCLAHPLCPCDCTYLFVMIAPDTLAVYSRVHIFSRFVVWNFGFLIGVYVHLFAQSYVSANSDPFFDSLSHERLIVIFCIVTPCSVVGGYQYFKWPLCFRLHDIEINVGNHLLDTGCVGNLRCHIHYRYTV